MIRGHSLSSDDLPDARLGREVPTRTTERAPPQRLERSLIGRSPSAARPHLWAGGRGAAVAVPRERTNLWARAQNLHHLLTLAVIPSRCLGEGEMECRHTCIA